MQPIPVPVLDAETNRLRAAGILLGPLLTPAQVAQVLHLRTASAGRRSILRGECGPYIRRGRKILVLRSSLLSHMAMQAVTVEPATPPPVPKPPPWAVDLLRGRKQRRNGGAR